MAAKLKAILLGVVAVFSAVPSDGPNGPDGNGTGNPVDLPAGIIPAWASSDQTIATTQDAADGLSTTVTSLKAGTITLAISAVFADGSTVSSSVQVTFAAANQVKSFTISQTS